MNDNIIPFRPRSVRAESERRSRIAVRDAKSAEKAAVDRYTAAHDIQRELSREFGFDVMLPGMPRDGDLLFELVNRLRDGLTVAAAKYRASSLLRLNGVHVFFSSPTNEIRDDHGYRSLRLSNNFSATDVLHLVGLMLHNKSARH